MRTCQRACECTCVQESHERTSRCVRAKARPSAHAHGTHHSQALLQPRARERWGGLPSPPLQPAHLMSSPCGCFLRLGHQTPPRPQLTCTTLARLQRHERESQRHCSMRTYTGGVRSLDGPATTPPVARPRSRHCLHRRSRACARSTPGSRSLRSSSPPLLRAPRALCPPREGLAGRGLRHTLPAAHATPPSCALPPRAPQCHAASRRPRAVSLRENAAHAPAAGLRIWIWIWGAFMIPKAG